MDNKIDSKDRVSPDFVKAIKEAIPILEQMREIIKDENTFSDIKADNKETKALDLAITIMKDFV